MTHALTTLAIDAVWRLPVDVLRLSRSRINLIKATGIRRIVDLGATTPRAIVGIDDIGRASRDGIIDFVRAAAQTAGLPPWPTQALEAWGIGQEGDLFAPEAAPDTVESEIEAVAATLLPDLDAAQGALAHLGLADGRTDPAAGRALAAAIRVRGIRLDRLRAALRLIEDAAPLTAAAAAAILEKGGLLRAPMRPGTLLTLARRLGAPTSLRMHPIGEGVVADPATGARIEAIARSIAAALRAVGLARPEVAPGEEALLAVALAAHPDWTSVPDTGWIRGRAERMTPLRSAALKIIAVCGRAPVGAATAAMAGRGEPPAAAAEALLAAAPGLRVEAGVAVPTAPVGDVLARPERSLADLLKRAGGPLTREEIAAAWSAEGHPSSGLSTALGAPFVRRDGGLYALVA